MQTPAFAVQRFHARQLLDLAQSPSVPAEHLPPLKEHKPLSVHSAERLQSSVSLTAQVRPRILQRARRRHSIDASQSASLLATQPPS